MNSTKADQFNSRRSNQEVVPERDVLVEHLAAGGYIDEFTFLTERPPRRPLRAGINAIRTLALALLASPWGSGSRI